MPDEKFVDTNSIVRVSIEGCSVHVRAALPATMVFTLLFQIHEGQHVMMHPIGTLVVYFS